MKKFAEEARGKLENAAVQAAADAEAIKKLQNERNELQEANNKALQEVDDLRVVRDDLKRSIENVRLQAEKAAAKAAAEAAEVQKKLKKKCDQLQQALSKALEDAAELSAERDDLRLHGHRRKLRQWMTNHHGVLPEG